MSVALAWAVATVAWLLADPRLYTTDFQFYWRGARLWSEGIDPYAMRPGDAGWPLWDRLFYPFPALFLVLPLTAADVRVAQTVFVGLGAGLLAWRLSREAAWPLLLFASPACVLMAFLGQWTPWLMLGALSPGTGFLLAAKPTVGLACFLYRPTWRAVWSGAAILALSLVLMPRWPVEWLGNLHSVAQHRPPLLVPGGFLLALAVCRWRQPEARLLLAMACVPQLLFFADQWPLALVARTKREAVLLLAASWASAGTWLVQTATATAATAWPYVLLGCYLPALYVVLRRPNEGPGPAWLDARLAHEGNGHPDPAILHGTHD